MTDPFVPISYQYFSSLQDWIHNGRYALTGHADYNNTEVVSADAKSGWQGHHFAALCFDQKGRRCLIGEHFQRAEAEGAYPIWWIWPDQIVPLLMAASADAGLKSPQGDTATAEHSNASLTQKSETPDE
jgi:hypothetical protein